MVHRKTISRISLSSLLAMIFILMLSTFGVSAATIPTSVSGPGSITEYSNFVEVTDPADLETGTTYYFSTTPLSSSSVLTSIPDGCAALRITTDTNNSLSNAATDGYEIQKYVDVVADGDGFDTCDHGGILYGTVSSFSGIDGTPGTGWYYWCEGGAVHGLGPFYAYACDIETITPADAVVTMNSNFQDDTTTITSSMFSAVLNGETLDSYTLTDTNVDLSTGDYIFTFTDNGLTFNVTIETYTVTYDAMGEGALIPSSTTATTWAGYSVTLPDVSTSRTLIGWYNYNDGNVGDAGDAYTPANDITLYAQYTDYYSVFFVDPDGTLYGFSSGEAGDEIIYPSYLPPTRDGYNFVGFETSGYDTYEAGDRFTGNVVYYAQWEPISYYYWLTGEGDEAYYTFSTMDTSGGNAIMAWYGNTVYLEIPTETDYVFIGWEDDTDNYLYGNIAYERVKYTISGETTLTPKFMEDFDSFKLVGFLDSMTGFIYQYDYRHINETDVTAPAAPTKDGYTFVQWTNSENSTDTLNPGDTVNFSLNTESGEKAYVTDWLGDLQSLSYSGALDSSTHVDSAFDSGNSGVDYRTGDTITFDCTGDATVADNDDVVPEDGYLISELHLSYTIDETPYNMTLFPDEDGICTFTMPAADAGVSYYAVAERYMYQIEDMTDSHTTPAVSVNGVATSFLGNVLDAEAGAEIHVSFTTTSGYTLNESTIVIECGGVPLYYDKGTNGTTDIYEFTMPAGDVEIYAESYYDAHTISLVTQNSTVDSLVNTTLSSDITAGTTLVPAGDTVTFTASPTSSYTITNIMVQDQGTMEYLLVSYDPISGEYSFTMPSAAVIITITAEVDMASLVMLDYDNTLLGIEVVEEGSTVDVDNAAGIILANGNTYTASTVPGYEFSQWEITANGDQFNSSSSISDYMIVKATYDPLDYYITLASDSSDDAEVTVTYSSGTGVTLTSNGNGTTTYTGDEIYVTATPDPNYEMTGVAVRAADGSITVVDTKLISKDPATGAWTYSFVMPAYDVEIAAYTEAIPYHLTVNELTFPEGGKYTIDGNTTTNVDVNQGEQTVIAVDPEPGYMIEHIAVYYQVGASRTYLIDDDNAQLYDNDPTNDLDTELPYDVTITMPAHDVTVDITYAKVNYTLTTTCVEATWGSFVGIPATANVGDVIDFTVIANYGYSKETLTILYGAIGISPIETATPTVDGDGKTTYYYQFTMPASNVDLKATFVKEVYEVIFEDYDGKTLQTQNVDYLDKPSVPNIIPTKTGYHFTGWTKDTTLENPGYGNSFSSDVFNTTQDTIIKATYEVNNYGINYVFNNAKGAVTGPEDADYNEEVTVNVIPETGYQINTVTATYVDANNVDQTITFTSTPADMEAGGNYVFTMPVVKADTDVTFTVTFTEIEYTAYLDDVDYANVTLNGYYAEDYYINADYNEIVTIRVTPDAGYELTGLTVTACDEVSPDVTVTPAVDPAGGLYTFTMPYYDVDVNVTIEPIEYSVDWNEDANSTISPNPSSNIVGDYDYKEAVAFTVTPDIGYQIKSVKAYYLDENGLKQYISFSSDDPADLTAACNYEFTMPMNDVHVVVVTEPIIYDVRVAVNGDGAYRLNDNDQDVTWTTAAYGSTVKITPEPALGWELDSIAANKADEIIDNHDGTYTLSMDVPDDVLVTITYIQSTYDIEYNTPANGAISDNDETMEYQNDASFTVTPAEGYQIKSVVGTYTDEDGHDQTITFKSEPSDLVAGGIYTFVMPAADVSIVVEFEKITYDVVVGSVTGQGEVRLDTTDSAELLDVPFDNEVTVTATPADGWYLVSLTVTNDTTSDTLSYTPTTLDAAGGDYVFHMPSSDVTVDVVFAQITYDIGTDITYVGYGTITVQSTAVEGETVDFDVTPNYGYQIKADSVFVKDEDGKPVTMTSDAYSFTMPAKDVTVYVTFEKIDYTVDFKDYDNKVLKRQDVPYLDAATAPTDPVREGYTFIGWDKDFSSVTEDMVITAQYQVNTPTVTVADTANGVTNVDNTTPDYGTTVTVTADPADGYRFDSISVVTEGGMTVPQTFISEDLDYVTTYTFTMPDDNVTVTVEYTEEASSDYTDVRTDAWFYEAVKFVTDRGYFYGVDDDIFAPRENMNRAMFVTVLGRLAKVDKSLYTVSAFEDVDINTWYGPYVAWAAANNIVSGYGDTDSDGQAEFGPMDNVTREQMAAIMYRYAEFGSYDLSGKNEEWMDKYIDSNLASSYATDAIAWCVGNGIIQGFSVSETEWKINPQGLATRAEVAQVIRNFVDKVIYK